MLHRTKEDVIEIPPDVIDDSEGFNVISPLLHPLQGDFSTILCTHIK